MLLRKTTFFKLLLLALSLLALTTPLSAQVTTESSLSPEALHNLQHSAREFSSSKRQNKVNLTLALGEENLELELLPHDIRAPGYRAYNSSNRGRENDPAQVQLFREPAAQTSSDYFARFALITEGSGKSQLRGYILHRGRHYRLAQDPANANKLRVGSLSTSEAAALVATCGSSAAHHRDETTLHLSGAIRQNATSTPSTQQASSEQSPPTAAAGLRQVQLATEADFEFVNGEGGTAGANATILAVLNAVDAIYQTELSLTIAVTFQNAWTTSSDPYTTTDANDFLDQFRDYWQSNFSSSQTYDLAHLWTGKNLDGSTVGIAFVGATCGSYRYGLSQNLNNTSLDVPLTAHEVGHNVGASHDSTCSSSRWIMCSSLQANADQFSTTAKNAIASHTGAASCLSMVSGGTPSVTLAINNSSISEAGGTATVTATLSSSTSQTVTVNLALSGTATGSGTDYSINQTTINITAGSTTGTAVITAVNDTLDEDNETVVVDISSVTNGTESGTQQVTTTITDNDSPPSVTLSVGSSSISETGGTTNLTATLSTASGKTVTVALSFSGTAVRGTDYQASATSIVINPGSSSGTSTLTAINDAIDEDDETITVDISSVTNGTESGTQRVTSTILDNDSPPSVSLSTNSAVISENGGVAVVTAALSAVSGKTVTVNLSTSGTATLNTDYSISTTSFAIAPGGTSGTASLTATADVTSDPNETAIVDISSVSNGTESGTQRVTITISESGVAPQITVNTITTADTTPALSGTVDNTTATVEITVNGNTYNATNNGNGTWTLSDNTISPALAVGVYNVVARATVTGGSFGTDTTSNELTISATSVPDNDNDGVPNSSDNCPNDANPTQADDDADGVGNACDNSQMLPSSPAYVKWNTFLQQWNFLELIAEGTSALDVTVKVYNISGILMSQTVVNIPAGSEFDVDINSLIAQACASTNPSSCSGISDLDGNGLIDSYGLVRVEYDDTNPNVRLIGRLSNYRQDQPSASAPNGSFSFALTRELKPTLRGTSFAVGNTFDPQGLGYLVPNWLELIYIGDSTGTDSLGFTVNLYNQAGTLVSSERVVLPGLQERDLAAGHTIVDAATGRVIEAVYLVEVIPDDASKQYLMSVTRYSSNSLPGVAASSYNYAVTAAGRAGAQGTLFAPISAQSYSCGSTLNWLEVANTTNSSVQASITFRHADGSDAGTAALDVLPPHSQYHYNASALLQNSLYGSAEISSNIAGALIATSMVYILDCDRNGIQTAYASAAREFGRALQVGTANSFIGMQNTLNLLATSSSSESINIALRTYLNETSSTSVLLPGDGAREVEVSASSGFTFPADRYGTLQLSASAAQKFLAQTLRVRSALIDGQLRVDFVVPTEVN